MTQATGLGNTNFYYVTAQGGYRLIPPLNAQSAAQSPQLPVLPCIDAPRVDAIGRRSLQPRPALATLQHLPTLEPQPLAASPHIHVGLEKFLMEKVAEHRRLASMRTDRQTENNSIPTTVLVQAIDSPTSNPSNLLYTFLPTSRVPAPMLRGELPPIQSPPPSQQGAVPATAAQALPQQQQASQTPASELSAVLWPSIKHRRPFDFRHRTPDSFRVYYDARKPSNQPGMPEPQPVPTPPVARPPRKRKEKPAAARLDFAATLTPDNYQAERAKIRRRGVVGPDYESSEKTKVAPEKGQPNPPTGLG